MRKLLNIILLTAGFVLLWGCDEYDDEQLRKNIDAIEQELTAAEKRVAELNDEMTSLTALINSSFISYLKQDDKGNYVVCYRDRGGETKTITLATQDDVVTAPIVGAGEFTDGKLYWRTTADNGETYEWLLDSEGKMMPVGGVPPTMGIDAEGFWTVNGERFTGKDGKPVLADDVSNTLFQKVETDEESGMVRFTLADGSSFEIPIFEALSIAFDAAPVTAIADRAAPVYIKYTLAGTEAEEAHIDYFTAYNVTVEIDKYTRTISVKLDEGAEEGNTVILVTAGGNTVLKPLFFTYGTAQIAPPTWDPQFGTGTEVALEGEFTEFDIKVSADIEYDVTIAEECQSWLKPAPVTRAPMVTTTHSFVADYYENDSGADRKGSITFSNRPYGVTVTLGVRQSPVIPDVPTDPGIATGADLVAFAKAVNAGGSTSRWENASGEVVLLNDIDLTGLTEWTPIGAGKATGTPSYNTLVNPFTGVFNGQGFTIKGIQWTFDAESETTHLHGLFGALKGATVKNLKLGAAGDQISVTGASPNVVAVGALTGYAEGSTITNVTNYVSVILTGDNPDATLMMLAGIAGCAKSTVIGGETKADAVINNGDVKTGRITNTANGGTGMNVGGICAFTLGGGIKIDYCTNNGEVSAPTGRGGGLVGTLGGPTSEESGTAVSNSVNNGTVQDDAVGQYGGSRDYYNYKRMGGLVGGTVTNNNLRIEYCTNNGNVFSQLGCRTGGFVGHNQATIVGCVNKGTILANITYDAGAPQHGPGWACGYSAKGLVTQCAKGGRVGEWDTYKDNPSGAPEATNDNALCYRNSEYFDPSQNY
ncbi:MAG: PL29 family lyase N-terminal domain-containing protein [Alistipes sp.]|nr:PL29 family lyase N-terminal domain-containing protein [Alistipes sp.]